MKKSFTTHLIFIICNIGINLLIYNLSNTYSIYLKVGLSVFALLFFYIIIGEFTYYAQHKENIIILKNRFFPWFRKTYDIQTQEVKFFTKRSQVFVYKNNNGKETRYALAEMPKQDFQNLVNIVNNKKK